MTDIENMISNIEYIRPFWLTKDFEEKHSTLLENYIIELSKRKEQDITKESIDKDIQTIRKQTKTNIKLGVLTYFYRKLIIQKKIKKTPFLNNILKRREVRENSGVMVFSVFTSSKPKGKDFSCKYDCFYCPSEAGQPRSYLKGEPGVDRAIQNDYDPIRQFRARGIEYIRQGHYVDKCEVIIQGGTWDSYDKDYREEFVRDIYFAANTFYDFVADKKLRDPLDLDNEILINETSMCRIIGLTPETRPDQITEESLRFLRKIGATRVQLGIQHTNDSILKYINRKCYSQDTIRAIRLLKDNCFKVDGHLMPDLPYPEEIGDIVLEDFKMLDTVNTDPEYKLDQIKIYPCMVTPHTRIQKWYTDGKYKPYGEERRPRPEKFDDTISRINWKLGNSLYSLIFDFCKKVHPSIRINRIIRDIPTTIVTGGTKCSSMRSEIENDLHSIGETCKCIRCREFGYYHHKSLKFDNQPELNILKFEASGGIEYFLSLESKGVLFSFLRLRLPGKNTVFNELKDCALIREVHTYGKMKRVDSKSDENSSQHRGYGKFLIEVAEQLSKQNGYSKIAVIPGVGVRKYYEKLGYNKDRNYHIKFLSNYKINYKFILIVFILLFLFIKFFL